MASAAESFRFTCGSERRAPECSKQRAPAATPQVGQGTETNCFGVRSAILIPLESYKTWRNTVPFETLYTRLACGRCRLLTSLICRSNGTLCRTPYSENLIPFSQATDLWIHRVNDVRPRFPGTDAFSTTTRSKREVFADDIRRRFPATKSLSPQ
jgi:hypothetical protein